MFHGKQSKSKKNKNKKKNRIDKKYKLAQEILRDVDKYVEDILEKITKILRDSTDEELQNLYLNINNSFRLYRLVINNLKIYKENVDQLILMYYELIKLLLEKITNKIDEKNVIT